MQNKSLVWLISVFAVVSFFGFADAAYLTAKHYLKTPLPCSITLGCESVTNSAFATIGPVPIALLGAIYYLTMLILSSYALFINRKTIQIAARLSPIGFIVSVYLVYLQLFVIYALCAYCVASAISSTLLFVLGVIFLKNKN